MLVERVKQLAGAATGGGLQELAVGDRNFLELPAGDVAGVFGVEVPVLGEVEHGLQLLLDLLAVRQTFLAAPQVHRDSLHPMQQHFVLERARVVVQLVPPGGICHHLEMLRGVVVGGDVGQFEDCPPCDSLHELAPLLVGRLGEGRVKGMILYMHRTNRNGQSLDVTSPADALDRICHAQWLPQRSFHEIRWPPPKSFDGLNSRARE
eukprot:766082-Hanusia_phi.AAC.4